MFDADRTPAVRSVLNGVAGTRLREVAVSVRGDPARAVEHDANGAFLLALRGYPEDLQPVVTLRFDGGERRRVALASTPNVVPDPLGGQAWKTEVGDYGCPVEPGQKLVPCRMPAVRDVRHRAARSPQRRLAGPVRGGGQRAGPPEPGALLRRAPPEREPKAQHVAVLRPLNGHLPRTACAACSARCSSGLVVTGPGGLRRTVRPSIYRAFLVVLDPSVHPRSLRVAIHYRDGRVQRTGPDHDLVPTPRP